MSVSEQNNTVAMAVNYKTNDEFTCSKTDCDSVDTIGYGCSSCENILHLDCALAKDCFIRYDSNKCVECLSCIECTAKAEKLKSKSPDLYDGMSVLFQRALNSSIRGLDSKLSQCIVEMNNLSSVTNSNTTRIDDLEDDVGELKKDVDLLKNKTSCDIESCIAELNLRKYKCSNIVLYNVKENQHRRAQSDFKNIDIKDAKKVLNNFISDIKILHAKRVTSANKNKVRPLVVRLGSKEEVTLIIRRRSELPSGVTVSSDQTYLQRQQLLKLKAECDSHNADHPDDIKKVIVGDFGPRIVKDFKNSKNDQPESTEEG